MKSKSRSHVGRLFLFPKMKEFYQITPFTLDKSFPVYYNTLDRKK